MVTKKCFKCNGSANIEFSHLEGPLCNSHFLNMIEKRVRKEVKDSFLEPKGEFTIFKEDNHRFHLTKYFLERVFKSLIKLKPVSKNAQIIPTSLDIEANSFLNSFYSNKDFVDNTVKPLRGVLEKELEEVCKILDIKYTKTLVSEELDKFEGEFPGTKFSILKSLKGYELHRRNFE